MRAIEVYRGSDGDVTKAYYARLAAAGAAGKVALNLFRAQKCSARAKVYRGGIAGKGSYRGMAYERKTYSMQELCRVLNEHGLELRIRHGWKRDPGTLFGGRESWAPKSHFPDFATWRVAAAHTLVNRNGSEHQAGMNPGPDRPDEGFGLTCADLDGNDGSAAMARVGKHAAGALLDGREWREFPRCPSMWEVS